MGRWKSRGTARAALGVGVGIALGAVGWAFAAIPAGNGTITACYKNSGGALRVIDADKGATCTSLETTLTWNQKGPTGPTGPGTTFHAAITRYGAIEAGDATAVDHPGTGVYEAKFPQPLTTCSAVASPGTLGSGVTALKAIGRVNVGLPTADVVRVTFERVDTGAAVNTDFQLIVDC